MKKLWFAIICISLLSCGSRGGKKIMSDYEGTLYREGMEEVKELEDKMSCLSSYTIKEIQEYLDEVSNLSYNNDTTDMPKAGKEACMNLESRINALKRNAQLNAERQLQTMIIPVEVNDDFLLEKTMAYPVYLERGDVLYYNIGLQKQGTVRVYNADARTLLKTYSQKTKVADSLIVSNKGIYLVEIVPGVTQYASADITYEMKDHSHLVKKINSEEVPCNANDFRATSNKGIKMRAAFDQPRKFTLSSQLKSTFTSAAKSIALVAVQIPAGSTDVLYSLRISTSEADKYSDGKFPENMNLSYHQIRFLGLPLYEGTRGSGLISSLLDENRPIREEDAYCNMYVFRSQSAAKLFQDGKKPASELSYDVDYSTLGTQSCNGRIPTKGYKTIYLAFENERVRYTNYIWVEVMTATPTTEYHTTRYTLE